MDEEVKHVPALIAPMIHDPRIYSVSRADSFAERANDNFTELCENIHLIFNESKTVKEIFLVSLFFHS